MLFHVGIFLIIFSIIVGFIAEGGNIMVLFQPYAALIILGTALGVFITSNPFSLLKSIWHYVKKIRADNPYKKSDYVQLLTFMFYFFRYVKLKGLLEIENDIEHPSKSNIFNEFPTILSNREGLVFFCDYMRMLVLGYTNYYDLENIMEEQINVKRHNSHEVTGALYKLADALPALGIIAAVLGVINAMGSIDAAPKIMGQKIGSALMGTFIGVAMSYCVVIPIAAFIEKFASDEAKFLECIKAGFIAFAKGTPPSIAVEFARQVVPINIKPSFIEIERAIEYHKTNRKIRKNVRKEASLQGA
ncbi:MAG: flagellar motor stator protein MotA [Alphaproteobacteria bacterium]|jgi:chemotaxis protein MotA|nr:flagellar motor stator protein MotA [Candidatus Jidaibacter sp.]